MNIKNAKESGCIMFAKKRALALLLFVLFTFTGCKSEKITKFSFRNEITWNSTASDVCLVEGAGKRLDNGWIMYYDVAVSNYTSDDLTYCFKDGVLAAVRYRLPCLSDENVKHIIKSLKSKYGEPVSQNKEYALELMHLVHVDGYVITSQRFHDNYNNWELADGTFIATWRHHGDSYQIVYLNSEFLSEWINKPNSKGL